jgi:membrane-bound lytic murein transglycosylase D
MPRDYEVRVPAHLLGAPMSELVAGIPDDQRFTRQLPDLYHTIARGDTLSEIAAEYDTRVSTLVALNGLGSSNRIRAGQQLRLPAAGPLPTATVAAVEPPGKPPAAVVPDVPAIADAPALAATPEMMAIDAVAETETVVLLAESIDTADLEPIESSLLSDPSDYSVAENLTIEIQPMETLGHYADWLGIKTQRLRDINGFAFRTPVAVGQRIKLEFKDTNVGAFESMRTSYHQQLQDTYFRNHTITGVREHQVGRGESVWILSLRQYDTPIWLFRQYNPSLDLHKVYPGIRLNFPVVVANEKS